MWKKNPEIILLSSKILEFSHTGTELFKNEFKELSNNNSKEYHLKRFQVLSEFTYFILHIINRIAFSKLGQKKRIKFQNILLPVVSQMMIEIYFDNWPKKYKNGIKNDFIDNINNAEIDYSKCKTILNDTLTKHNPNS